MINVTRYDVPSERRAEFEQLLPQAVSALSGRPGCGGVWAGPGVDDPTEWVLVSVWETVGAFRRALSSYEVKLHAVPLMYLARDEPSAYETTVAGLGDGVQIMSADGISDDTRGHRWVNPSR